MPLPTAKVVAVEFAKCRVWIDNNLCAEGQLEPRRYEIALLCVLAAVSRRQLTLSDLQRELVGNPSEGSIRRHIKGLAEDGLLELRADVVEVAIGGSTEISPSVWQIERSLDVVQRLTRARLRNLYKFASVQERLALAEQALLINDGEGVRKLFDDERPLLSLIQQNTSGRYRVELCAMGRRFLADAALARGNPLDVLKQAVRGLALVNEPSTPRAAEEAVRLRAAAGSAHRMLGAFEPGVAKEQVAAAYDQYAQALALLDDRSVPFEEQVRTNFTRWMGAAISTPLVLRGDLREAEQHILSAEQALGTGFSSPADPAETQLLLGRVRVAQGQLARADDAVTAAEKHAGALDAPPWIQGWSPRYRADLRRLEGDPPEEIFKDLLVAWDANQSIGFQRLLILARLAAWGIDPVDFGPARSAEFAVDVDRWHKALSLSRTPAKKCKVCNGRLLPAIRCFTGMAIQPTHPWQQLGMWR